MTADRRERVRETRRVEEDRRPREAEQAPAHVMLSFQRTHGNQAVQRMIDADGVGGGVLARNKTKEKPSDWPAELKKAIKAGEWRTAAMVCWVLSDAEIRPQFDKLSDSDLDSIEAEAKTMDTILRGLHGKVHRHVSFQKHDPGKATKVKQVDVEDEGDLEHSAKVGGGKVAVHTDVEANVGDRAFDEMFSLSYKGKDAAKTRWLQFIWREIEVDEPTKGNFLLDEPVTTTGGTYPLTTDRSKPSYNTDSSDPDSPFYEAGFVSNRTSEATTIFDQPSPMKAKVDAQFDAGATKVVSRAHFTTYLVREMDVLHEVRIDVEWVFATKGDVPRSQSVSKAGNASAIDAAMRKRLIEQYPDFDYLP